MFLSFSADFSVACVAWLAGQFYKQSQSIRRFCGPELIYELLQLKCNYSQEGGGVGFQPHFRKNIIFVRNMFLCMKIVNPYSHCLLLWIKGHCLCITSGPHAGDKGRTLDPHKLQAYYNITRRNGQLQYILHSNLWDTVGPQTVDLQAPVVYFLYIFTCIVLLVN